MHFRSLIFLFAALGALAPAAEPLNTPDTLIAEPARATEWQELFTRLAPNKNRQSAFEERRYFPFRTAPVVLKGEIRIVPELGLSLRYLQPEERVVIVDAKGVLVRDENGEERAAPNDPRARAITAALVDVLRFDLPELQKTFAVHGRRDGENWMLAFIPRDAALATTLGALQVSGRAAQLTKIEMIKSEKQRIEILINDTHEGVLFTGDTLRRFFR